jgi:hypothetical protein
LAWHSPSALCSYFRHVILTFSALCFKSLCCSANKTHAAVHTAAACTDNRCWQQMFTFVVINADFIKFQYSLGKIASIHLWL